MVCISSKLRSRPSYIIVKQKANILNTEVNKINKECNFGKRKVLELEEILEMFFVVIYQAFERAGI